MCAAPLPRTLLICSRTPEVDQYHDDQGGQDDQLLAEVIDGDPLPDAIPFREGAAFGGEAATGGSDGGVGRRAEV